MYERRAKSRSEGSSGSLPGHTSPFILEARAEAPRGPLAALCSGYRLGHGDGGKRLGIKCRCRRRHSESNSDLRDFAERALAEHTLAEHTTDKRGQVRD